MSGGRQSHTDQFYGLLAELARREGVPRQLGDCARSDGWPRHGVYFFYEDGEVRADGSGRVVRVGTHALTATSRTTLWARLRQHEGGSAAGTPAAATTGHQFSAHTSVPR